MKKTLTRIYLIVITALLHGAVNAAEPRFVPLDGDGKPLAAIDRDQLQEWPCVLDQRTGLVWEGKSQATGLHHLHNTFNWFDTDHTRNGGLAGEPGDRSCRDGAQKMACDTQGFVQAVNRERLCNATHWRLPHREELRGLVDYRIPYPGPTIDMQAFPNTIAQFYWSADANASEPKEAWGIGFAFGFDYAYFKSNRVHVRLVSGDNK
jgi:hypothetical protein